MATQRLSLPFNCRSQSGKISITLQPNKDSVHAWGLDLLVPDTPPSYFQGYPVLTATITYPLYPSAEATSGFASLFGWISFAKYPNTNNSGKAEWVVDVYPWAKNLKSPFSYWGFCPTFFAANAVLMDEKDRDECKWEAQCFLCTLVDAGREKKVVPIRGAGFTWGFEVETVESVGWGLGGTNRRIVLKNLEDIDVESEWKERMGLLKRLYPNWEFLDAGHEI